MRLQASKFFLEIKKLWKPFLALFLLSFFIFNWNDFSWIFNYHFWRGLTPRFSSEDIPEIIFKPTREDAITTNARMPEKEFEYSEKEDSLEIPGIGIDAPLFFVESQDEKTILKSLDRGVVLLADSALPGKPGQTIIVGHSARHNWPKTNYAWVFTYLNEVKEGDEIIVHFNHRKYPYSVTKKFILKEGEEIPQDLTNSENILILITCWPPGRLSMKQRLAVEARPK